MSIRIFEKKIPAGILIQALLMVLFCLWGAWACGLSFAGHVFASTQSNQGAEAQRASQTNPTSLTNPTNLTNLTNPTASTNPASSTFVKFNGVPAEIISIAGAEIKAMVPLGATTGPIIVETETAVLFSDTDFEVNVRPAPYGVSARSSVDMIEIFWIPPIAENLSGYNVYRAESQAGPYSKIASGVADVFYLDESASLEVGKTYFYKVSSVFAGGKESEMSLDSRVVFGNISLWIPNVNAAQEKRLTRGQALSQAMQVPVNIENADKFAMGEAGIYIDYDPSVLKPLAVEKTILSRNYEWDMDASVEGTVKVFIKNPANEKLRGVGTLFNVIFGILDSAAEGSIVEFKFHKPGRPDTPSFIKSPEKTDIPLELSDGALQVQLAYRKGDVNGDINIFSNDSSAALGYAMGIMEPAKGPLSGGDVDGDGTILTNDAGLILYRVVNTHWPSLEDVDVYWKDRQVDFGGNNAQQSRSKYLNIPLYINTLNDMHSGIFDVVYPHELLKAVKFILDPKLTKKFKAESEFRKKGLAEISLIYKQTGRAAVGFSKTKLGDLRFEVLSSGPAAGDIAFSKVNLYDRFGRDFVRSDLRMAVTAGKTSFKIKGARGNSKNLKNGIQRIIKKTSDSSPVALGVKDFSPKKGKPGDIIVISLDLEGASDSGMVQIVEGNLNFEIDKYEYPNFLGAMPETSVTWNKAKSLCEAQDKRLCSQDEWIAACRGTENFSYPYGNAYEKEKCNGADAGLGTVMPVGAMSGCASGYGVHDLSGNVSEWSGASSSEAAYIGGDAGSGESGLGCYSINYADAAASGGRIGFRCCR